MSAQPVIFGEVLFDCFEDGSRVLGGAPFNVAWHLQAFGARPLFVSRVGDDPMGRDIRGTMQEWGMPTAALQMDSQHPTGEVQVTLDQGQPSYAILEERAWDYIDADHLPPLQPALFYHGSLGLRGPASERALQQLLQQYAAPVFMDVNLRSPWWDHQQLPTLLERAHWLKINDEELELLTPAGTDLHTRAQHLLQAHDLQLVLVTRGAAGAFTLDRDDQLSEIKPQTRVEVVDTVGAGDGFASVCILGILQQWPMARTLERAQQFASLLVSQRGATLSDPQVYAELKSAWQLA